MQVVFQVKGQLKQCPTWSEKGSAAQELSHGMANGQLKVATRVLMATFVVVPCCGSDRFQFTIFSVHMSIQVQDKL